MILIIYLIGCIIVMLFGKHIMILGFKTMKEPYEDDHLPMWHCEDKDDFPTIVYAFMLIGLSWLSIFLIYFVTTINISYNRKNKQND